VFLGNIDPRLQLEVLTQVSKPRLVACDTMNFLDREPPERRHRTVGPRRPDHTQRRRGAAADR
jgi:hypothetical protein